MSAIADDLHAPETHSEGEILDIVRQFAAGRDPRYRHLYDGMSPARIKHSTARVQRVLETHLGYLRLHPRDRGRRQHTAETYDRLAELNQADLVVALSVLDLTLAILPPGCRE